MNRALRFASYFACLLVTAPTVGWSQESDGDAVAEKASVAEIAASSDPESPAADLVQQRADLAKQLESVQERQSAAIDAGEPDKEALKRLGREIELLQQLDLVLSQRHAAADRIEQLQSTVDTFSKELTNLRADPTAMPGNNSFLTLDHLRDEQSDVAARLKNMSAAMAETAAAVDAAVTVREQRDQARRAANEAAKLAAGTQTAAALKVTLTLANFESRLAGELVLLRKSEQQQERLGREILELRQELLEFSVRQLERTVEFTDEQLQDQIDEFEHLEESLQREIEAAQLELTYHERKWFDARQLLDSGEKDPATFTDEVETWHVGRETGQQAVALMNQQLKRLGFAKSVWQRRYAVFHDLVGPIDRDAWKTELLRTLEDLEREERLQSMRMSQLRKDQATLDSRMQAARSVEDESVRWLRQQQQFWQRLIQEYDANLGSIVASRRLNEKLQSEISSSAKLPSAAEWLAAAWSQSKKVWNYELTSIDDRPITVGKIIGGLILLMIGFFLSRQMSWFIGRRLLPGLGMHIRLSAALESILFYVLITTFTLAALKLVAVPLTVFTLLGGALAIGVGLGSQNAINNFISGLILLVDRPIRVHDTIDLDGVYGTVEGIGMRSTRLKTPDNLEIMVPNSVFLQTNVVNLTLTDHTIRTKVAAGVVYGSDPNQVEQLMLQAVKEHDRVFKKPAPFVWFMDFGNNSLDFEVHFWIELPRIYNKFQIESDIRFRINALFNEAGVVIAFPQRDVHLDTSRPLEIRLEQSA